MTAIRPNLPVDLALTLGPLKSGPRDATCAFDGTGAWIALRAPDGIATLRLVPRGAAIALSAWGPGADWAIAHAPDLVGARDSLEGFRPEGKLADLHRRFPGLRLARTHRVFDALVPTILEQRVTGREAHDAYALLVRRWGEIAPGPKCAPRLLVPPSAATLAKLPYWAFHEVGVERRRAETVLGAARRAKRIEEAAEMEPAAALARLEAIRGVGPWTSGKVALNVLGDADALPIGDYHLPHAVTYAFTGRARGDDAEMLELLAPFAPHRGRVVRLLAAAGIGAPRFGPRRALRRVASL